MESGVPDRVQHYQVMELLRLALQLAGWKAPDKNDPGLF